MENYPFTPSCLELCLCKKIFGYKKKFILFKTISKTFGLVLKVKNQLNSRIKQD